MRTFLLLLGTLFLSATLLLSSCSSNYCVGGKKKYKRMKKDHGNMVF